MSAAGFGEAAGEATVPTVEQALPEAEQGEGNGGDGGGFCAGGGGGGREERVCPDACGTITAAGDWEGTTTSATHVTQWKKQVPGTSHNMIASAAQTVQYIIRKRMTQSMIHFTNHYNSLTARLVHCTEKSA